MNNKKSLLISLLVLLAVVVAGGLVTKYLLDKLTQAEARIDVIEKVIFPPKEEEEVQKEAFDVPVGNSFVLGPKDAPISVTVFSNFQCPYCAMADTALRTLVNNEKLQGKVNLVFKHFPFDRHASARPASKAAFAAGEQGNDKFWAMSEKIFAHQSDLKEKNPEQLNKMFTAWAKEIGCDVNKFEADLKANDQKYDDQINQDIKLGAEKAELRGTPWILVNGWLLKGDINAETILSMSKEHKLQ
ncbi:MAG: DsbA family protein [Myxococcales bacterium]|nr:DsbA family protein [Myxococcales bacterium]USN50668.1 MAG: DsbA family protein [Myxococcales bacterium]